VPCLISVKFELFTNYLLRMERKGYELVCNVTTTQRLKSIWARMPCDIAKFSHRVEAGSWAAWWMTIFKLLCVCCVVCVLQYVLQCAFWNFFSVSSFVRNRVITLIFDIVFFQVWTKVFKTGTARLSGVFDCWTPSRHGLDWYTSTSPVLSMSWPGSIPCDTDTCGQTPWMCWSTCLPPTIVCGKLSKAPGASPPWHTRVVSTRLTVKARRAGGGRAERWPRSWSLLKDSERS